VIARNMILRATISHTRKVMDRLIMIYIYLGCKILKMDTAVIIRTVKL